MSAALALVDPPSASALSAAIQDERDTLTQWVQYFEESELSSIEARDLASKCRDYFDGRQYTAEEMAELRRRHQPPTVNNKIKPKIMTLLGLERKGRSDPKAFPRTPVEDMRADAATQALRYIADQNRFDVIRSSVIENILIEGIGGCEVIVQPVQSRQQLMGTSALSPNMDYDILINHIPFDRFFYDPYSRHPGFSDATYLGIVIWMDRREALRRYPNCADVIEDTLGTGAGIWDGFDDTPKVMWADARRRRVRVVQMWVKTGEEWSTGTFTKGGFVEPPMVSPYLDRHGNPACPLIFRSCFCDRDNNRYGVVRDLIPLQDAINKRESKLLHSLSVNQLIFEQGAVDNVDEARREAAKPDGVIPRNKGFEFEIRKDTAEIQGHFQLLQYSITQMEGIGPNANMMGKDPREQSGRAILAQQAGGAVENEPNADTGRQWTHKVWEFAWALVRQFWTNERWIRVTDTDKNVRFVGLNKRVTLGDLMAELDPKVPLQEQLQGLPPDERRAVMFGLRLQPGDPHLQMLVKVENDVADMDVDITIEEGPDSPTVRAEAWGQFMGLPQPVLIKFPPEVFVNMNPGLSADDKSKLTDILKEQEKAGARQAQREQAMHAAMADATIADKQAQAEDKHASAMQKVHGMAMDHAQAQHTPLVPGVGPVAPEINPLLQPQPPQPQGGM